MSRKLYDENGNLVLTAGRHVTDKQLDATSNHAIANKVVTAALAGKQDKTDNNLNTTDKTIVGAINEHESDINTISTNLSVYSTMRGTCTYADFNSITEIGDYWIDVNVTTANRPDLSTPLYGVLTMSVVGSGAKLQRFVSYGSPLRIFYRMYANNVWGSWVELNI